MKPGEVPVPPTSGTVAENAGRHNRTEAVTYAGQGAG
jgi:hypothetical protein